VRLQGLALILTLLATSAPAWAQDPGVAGGLERTATTTPEQKLQYASDGVEELRAAVTEVSKLMEEARRNGDTEQIECLANRMSQLRALAQVVEMSELAMRDALEAGQEERANHEFRKVGVALSKSRQLLLEAQACVDQAGVASGDTVVRVEGGLTGDEDETDPLDVDVLDQGFDPPQESPFN